MTLKFAKLLPDNKRPQILEAVEVIVARRATELMTSVSMPPRVGKSSVIRLSALEMFDGFPAIVLAPWRDNAVQILDDKKIKDMFKTYGIRHHDFKTHRCRFLKTHEWWRLSQATPTLISATIGLVQNQANQQQFLDGIKDIYERSERRVLVFVDEAHLVKDKKKLGEFVHDMIKHGAYVVLLTGTAVPGIPGFKEAFSEWQEVVRRIPRHKFEDGEIKYYVERHEGEGRKVLHIDADYNMTWKQAFDIGAMANANAIWIDVDVTDHETGEPLGPLSGLAVEDLQGRLKGIVEDEELMIKMAAAAIERLRVKRIKHPTTRMLIVTGRDEYLGKDDRSAEANKHAKRYLQILKRAAERANLELRFEIATGVDSEGEPDEESAGRIERFREGKIDGLIVKTMGLVGLDVPENKVLLFASTLRQGPMAIQALSRVLTVWLGCAADLIMQRDKKMEALYNGVIKDQGGEWRESKLTLVGTDEVDAPEPKAAWMFSRARVSAYSDERGKNRDGDFETILSLIKAKYQTDGLSDLQIIENYELGGFPVSDEERNEAEEAQRETEELGICDLDAGLDSVTGTFGNRANDIVSKYVDYVNQRELWQTKLISLQREAKRLCGVENRSVSRIDDAALLRSLVLALDVAERTVFGHVRRKSL